MVVCMIGLSIKSEHVAHSKQIEKSIPFCLKSKVLPLIKSCFVLPCYIYKVISVLHMGSVISRWWCICFNDDIFRP